MPELEPVSWALAPEVRELCDLARLVLSPSWKKIMSMILALG